MRSRLLLLIIIPTLTSVVLGALFIGTQVRSALAYQRVETLAGVGSDVTGLAMRLEDERDQTLEYIGEAAAGTGRGDTSATAKTNLGLVTQDQKLTAPWIAKVRADTAAAGDGYPAQVRDDLQNIRTTLGSITQLRSTALGTNASADTVQASYTHSINTLLAIDNDIAADSSDPTLSGQVRALGLMSVIDEEASEQRGLLASALESAKEQPTLSGQAFSQLQTASDYQAADAAEFNRVATAQQIALYNHDAQGSQVDQAGNDENTVLDAGPATGNLSSLRFTAAQWYGAMTTGTIGGIRQVEQSLVSATIARATALRRDAIITASAVGAAVLVVLLLSLLLTTVVGRSMVRPLRRLRSGALEVAGVRLPETVRRMSESDGTAVSIEVEPIEVDSADEVGEVARAFDQVHREALRLAANEAALRGNVNAMFVNLSRRSQSLVERQIRLIDDLEQGEQDADRLASLFQMDHLATRMRRNSENLLVLAGHEATRRWNQPVALVDVLRAAVSEIEQYERVRLNVQPGISVRGHAVNDVVHLLAELAENATSFSSADTPVVVAGHLLSSGGVLLDITDQGVGMGAEEMAHANWRLDNPPVVDVAVSRRMGLFVVARLAARHGIRVRLRPAPAGGLTALVWLPDEVISHQGAAGASGPQPADLAAVAAIASPAPAPAPAAVAAAPAAALLQRGRNGGAAPAAIPAGDSRPEAAAPPGAAAAQAGLPRRVPNADGGLGPRRVPGASVHPGLVGRGAAATSPLPAVGSKAAETELAATAAAQSDPGGSGEQARPPAPVPAVPAQRTLGVGQTESLRRQSSGGGVIVPPPEFGAGNRLPIFEGVESDWFRHGRAGGLPEEPGGLPQRPAGNPAGSSPSGPPAPDGASRWPAREPAARWRSSRADEGWQAAAAVSAPSTGGTTEAGLPRRVPQANLVPGTAPAERAAAPAPARSATATRDRFASFQAGMRKGRAEASRGEGNSDENAGS